MKKSKKYIKDLIQDLSPADMTEILRCWMQLKDARFMFSLEWKPMNKVDLGDNTESIFTILTKDNESIRGKEK